MGKEITFGELIESEKFQTLLAEQVKKVSNQYDEAAAGRNFKRNAMMRLRELDAEDHKKMTELYGGIIGHNSRLPAAMREYVEAICVPILNKCLLDLMREQREKEAEDGTEAQP